jgi:membrane-bound lytic murein transglycosylase D
MVRAAEETIDMEDLLEQGEAVLRQVAPTNLLQQLQVVDDESARRVASKLQDLLQGEYVLDLAPFRDTALMLLPWCEQDPDLKPYAAWLKPRMDYFDAVDRLRLIIAPPRKLRPGELPPRQRNPSPPEQRQVWTEVILKETPSQPAADRLAKLKTIFKTAGVPRELVWLAEVESSFDPAARSPSGAVGLYQLMPGTAQALGLATEPTDDRLVPDKNAAAAARHLKHLYWKFSDWPLAIAAYNAGEGRVGRLLKTYRAKTFQDIAARLPAETQLYVPKVDAVLRRQENTDLASLDAAGG